MIASSVLISINVCHSSVKDTFVQKVLAKFTRSFIHVFQTEHARAESIGKNQVDHTCIQGNSKIRRVQFGATMASVIDRYSIQPISYRNCNSVSILK